MSVNINKIHGVILGGAIGDALGAPAEGVRREEMRERHEGLIDNYFELQDLKWYENHPDLVAKYWRMGGLHTDDTQMMLAIIDCFLENNRIDEKELAGYFHKLFPVARGTGRGYRAFYKNMEKNIWPAAMPNNAGSGSAMRAGIIGIITQMHVPFMLLRNAYVQSEVTHSDQLAHLASILISVATYVFASIDYDKRILFNHKISELMVSTLIQSKETFFPRVKRNRGTPDFEDKIEQFIESIRIVDIFFKNNSTAPRHTEIYKILVELIAENASKYRERPATGTKNFALEAPLTAFATAIFYGHNFPEAIMNAINLGGDTDTVASMVGQIVGAYHGFDPNWWSVHIEKEGINIIPDNNRAKQETGIPLEWFLPLKAKWQLFHRGMQLGGIKEYEMPPLSKIVGDDKDKEYRELLEFETELTQQERDKKKLIQEYFRNITKYKRDELPDTVRGMRRP